jgi:hypothetical protein
MIGPVGSPFLPDLLEGRFDRRESQIMGALWVVSSLELQMKRLRTFIADVQKRAEPWMEWLRTLITHIQKWSEPQMERLTESLKTDTQKRIEARRREEEEWRTRQRKAIGSSGQRALRDRRSNEAA